MKSASAILVGCSKLPFGNVAGCILEGALEYLVWSSCLGFVRQRDEVL